jgi:CRISPR-associated endonuclease/helicase Cas3
MREKIIEYYKQCLGNSFHPYEYQIRVAELLLKGKSVILSVPTGAGKTWASIMPFLYAKTHQEIHFPQKMIYSLPLRTLANSIYEDVSQIVDGTSIQTGEYANDIYFENDIIFSTIDQTLSNFLCFPLPLSHRQANMNAGALIGSYLVFDEFHLLDEQLSMATTIGMLQMLGNLSRCCIMTATLSNGFMDVLKSELDNYEVITLDDFPQDKAQIGSLKPEINKKQIKLVEDILTAKKIIEKHIKKSIVICNRVEKAQQIYNDLINEQKKPESLIVNTKIICLHSRFFESDRKAKEKDLKILFGKGANDQSVILISTQVIEAGMDISCEAMHTEISPISSFLQRAGRNARFDNQTGSIFIYDVLDIEEKNRVTIENPTKEEQGEINKLNNKYLPYKPEECTKTMAELKKQHTLDGNIPKKLIETILGNEKEIIAKMKTGQFGGFNQDKIKESWEYCQKNHYRSTIRDIQSVEIVLINDKTRKEIEKHPFKYQSLGMYKWSFVSWLNAIYDSDKFDKGEDWLVMELKEANDMFLENDESTTYELKEIKKEQFKSLPRQVYVNTKYFGYDAEFGFNYQFEQSLNQHAPLREIIDKETEFKPLTKDTFVEHNLGLIAVFEKEFLGINRNNLNFIAKEIAKSIDSPDFGTEDLIRAIYLMIILHDYGKLNDNWQKPMQKYQGIKKGIDCSNQILAHTDYDDKLESDKQIAKDVLLHKRPAHAGVGAFIAQEIVPELFGENDYLKSSISMAIARHHSPLSKSYPQFNISEKNYQAVRELIDKFEFEIELNRAEKYAGEIDEFQFQGFEEQVLYLFFVRILRLCDQKATENLKAYLN